MGKNIKKFDDFTNEKLTLKDAKSTIKDMFDKFNGEVTDKFLKGMWKAGSTVRNLYGKEDFDKAWEDLVRSKNITTEDGKTWKWSGKY